MRFELEYGRAPRWPSAVAEPEEVGAARVICVAWHGETSRLQNQRIERWCAALPGLVGVEGLFMGGQVPQRLFDAACGMPALRVLQLKWNAIRSLDALSSAAALRQLDLGSSAKLESIAPLGEMKLLDQLWVENAKRITDLEPIASLTALSGLSYAGGMDGRPRVATLDPLAALTSLRWFDISALWVEDRSLRALGYMTELRHVRVPRWYPAEQYAYVVARVPALRSDLRPTDQGKLYGPCPRCGNPEMALPVGYRQRRLCPVCDAIKLKQFLDAFEADIERFSTS